MDKNINNSLMLEMEEESFFDFKQLWTIFRLNWYWIVISMVLCVLIAFVYLRFTPTTVTVSNKMQLMGDSKQSGSSSAKAAVLNALPMGLGSSLGGGSLGIETEKEILKSGTLIREVVNELNLHTEYRTISWGRGTLLYKNQPLVVSLDPAHLQWFDEELLTSYHQIDLTIKKHANLYQVDVVLTENKEETRLPSQEFSKLPADIKTEFGVLTIAENLSLTTKERQAYTKDYSLKITIIPPMICSKIMAGKMTLEAPSKKVSNLLIISFSDENHIRGIDFINSLVEHYNKRANDEKNEEVMRNEEFVNNRMAKLDKEMGSSDAAWETSKKNFQITDPEVDAQEVMAKKSMYDTQLVAIGTELQLHDFLSEYVNDPDNLYEIIPSAAISSGTSVGIDGSTSSTSGGGASGTASLLTQHNMLVSQRKDLLKSVSEKSPQIQRVEQSINELQPVIQTALKRDRQQILMRQNTLQREYGRYLGRVSTAPQMERVLTEIGRQREIKQGVYLLMLQKREEAAMGLAQSAMKGKLIDETMVSGPEKPNRKMIILIAVLLGALLPMGILYLIKILKTKIDTCAELVSVSRFPVIGEIPLQDSIDAIRNLRTNLLLNLKEDQKAILIASNAEGDGKSFIAKNLVDSLNAIGKKTFLIDGDLRKSNRGGHPADILASESFAQQVAKAKSEYDYVVFDSPAMSKYADAYQMASFADATIYIVKSGSTEKSSLSSLSTDKKFPNIMLALNAIDTTTKKYKLINN